MPARVQQDITLERNRVVHDSILASVEEPPSPDGAWDSGAYEIFPAQVFRSAPLSRESSMWRIRGREPILQMPEMLIFTLGLAALLSLIVFTCDMLNTRTFRPMSVLVFVASASYCIVLIKRQRAVAAAEEAIMLEFAQQGNVEPAPRILGKTERRALLNYFVFQPPGEGVQVQAMTPGDGVSGAGGGIAEGIHRDIYGEKIISGETLPPSSPGSVSASCIDVEGMEQVIVDVEMGITPVQVATAPPCEEFVECIAEDRRKCLAEEAEALGASELGELGRIKVIPRDGAMGSDGRGGVLTGSGDGAGDCGIMRDRLDARVEGIEGCEAQQPEMTGNVKGGVMANKGDEMDQHTPRRAKRGSSWEWSSMDACVVCFGEYVYGDKLCRLPCRHVYHAECIDQWLDGVNHAWCPLCKQDLLSAQTEETADGFSIAESSAANYLENEIV